MSSRSSSSSSRSSSLRMLLAAAAALTIASLRGVEAQDQPKVGFSINFLNSTTFVSQDDRTLDVDNPDVKLWFKWGSNTCAPFNVVMGQEGCRDAQGNNVLVNVHNATQVWKSLNEIKIVRNFERQETYQTIEPISPSYYTPNFIWDGMIPTADMFFKPGIFLNASTTFADARTMLKDLPADYYRIYMRAVDTLDRTVEGYSPIFIVKKAGTVLPPLASYVLVNPNPGTIWLPGKAVQIQFSIPFIYSDKVPTKIRVDLLDAYTNQTSTKVANPIANNVYVAVDENNRYNYTTWNIPANLTDGGKYRLKLTGVYEQFETSDPPTYISGIFSIGLGNNATLGISGAQRAAVGGAWVTAVGVAVASLLFAFM
ncbi:hypothetical protein HDU96_000159 [Phlyctochytrium bullatum]|nr:hypothetical protein HDU96_000159 [Phlyctochytrium bullatum]